MYIKRTLENVINEVSECFKVVLLIGARQVGKSTLFEHCKKSNRTYVSLDNAEDRMTATSDPKSFFEKYKFPILIDEVQRAPNLFLYIKEMVDKSDTCGSVWLTGSQSFHLMKNVSDSLVGRVCVLNLYGFSQCEKLNDPERGAFNPMFPLDLNLPTFDKEYIFERIFEGSYPFCVNNISQREFFYSSYISTYIERDLREILNISNEVSFLKFLRLLATRIGTVLNYADISRDLGISSPTIKNWLSALISTNVVYLLPSYANNLSQRIIRSPKIYFMDTGLCAYLSLIGSAKMLMDSPYSGAYFENYVITEIIKSYAHNGKRPFLYYFRSNDNTKEIDVIIEENGKIFPIEIKESSSPTPDMARHFSVIDKAKLGRGIIICNVNKIAPLSKDIVALPVSYI